MDEWIDLAATHAEHGRNDHAETCTLIAMAQSLRSIAYSLAILTNCVGQDSNGQHSLRTWDNYQDWRNNRD